MAVIATPMAMPETAMHKDHGFEARENDIGLSRQTSVVDAETISQRMN
jgi:hypothetical protein